MKSRASNTSLRTNGTVADPYAAALLFNTGLQEAQSLFPPSDSRAGLVDFSMRQLRRYIREKNLTDTGFSYLHFIAAGIRMAEIAEGQPMPALPREPQKFGRLYKFRQKRFLDEIRLAVDVLPPGISRLLRVANYKIIAGRTLHTMDPSLPRWMRYNSGLHRGDAPVIMMPQVYFMESARKATMLHPWVFEISLHELGHAFDVVTWWTGQRPLSYSENFNAAYQQDMKAIKDKPKGPKFLNLTKIYYRETTQENVYARSAFRVESPQSRSGMIGANNYFITKKNGGECRDHSTALRETFADVFADVVAKVDIGTSASFPRCAGIVRKFISDIENDMTSRPDFAAMGIKHTPVPA